MDKSARKVETVGRIAQWRINNLTANGAGRYSEPFRIAMWNWHLSVEKNWVSCVRLYPDRDNLARDNRPIASYIIRVLTSARKSKSLIHSEINDRLFEIDISFVWEINVPLPGNFVIEVEFLDFKTACAEGGEPCTILTNGFMHSRRNSAALECLGRMLTESVHTDITINTCDGSIGAHRAVLAARSPVFHSMFFHNLKEKNLSTINISDMSIEACVTFLNYLYGTIKAEEFLTHRLALLHAAGKYDIPDLKEICQESLVEDIDAKNVIEKLQIASLYPLPKLKISCMQYLVKFGKILDIRDDFRAFLQSADKDLISEVFNEVLDAWNK